MNGSILGEATASAQKMQAGAALAQQAKQQSQVDEALVEQQLLIAELRGELDRTRSGFVAALLPEPSIPGETSAKNPEPPRSPLYEAINSNTIQIRYLLWELRGINSRSTL